MVPFQGFSVIFLCIIFVSLGIHFRCRKHVGRHREVETLVVGVDGDSFRQVIVTFCRQGDGVTAGLQIVGLVSQRTVVGAVDFQYRCFDIARKSYLVSSLLFGLGGVFALVGTVVFQLSANGTFGVFALVRAIGHRFPTNATPLYLCV